MRKRMIVFGAGTRGEEFIRGTTDQVVAIWDNDVTKSGMPLHGVTITTPPKSVNEIAVDYDAIVIAITDWQPERVAMLGAMLEQLKKIGIPFHKIELTKRYSLKNPRVTFLRHFSEQLYENNVDGAVAECGVYRGHFAQMISEYFPDRTLYLFDTFDGFNQQDIDMEFKMNSGRFVDWWNNNSSEFAYIPKFEQGDIDIVKIRTRNSEKVEIRKGYVPNTFSGLEKERFAFVNLDMDLYAPQLAGLRFFFDRMNSGGVILLHDYFLPLTKGIKKAVDEFALERKFMRLPIGDNSSIAIIKE